MSKKKLLDAAGISAFCESMALMIRSGIQVEEAIALLAQEGAQKQAEHKKQSPGLLSKGLDYIHTQVEQGESLAEAMKGSGIFPEYCLTMTAAGEATGNLEPVLFRLASYYINRQRLSSRLRSAITYPAAMLVLILLVLVVMLSMVLPVFSGVYTDLTGGLTTSYRYLGLAYGFCWIAFGLILILLVLCLVGICLWKCGHEDRLMGLAGKHPSIGRIQKQLAMFRFTSAFAMFLGSGELQDEAFLDSIPMVGHAGVEACLRRISQRMEQGHGFAQAAFDEGLFEPVYGRMLLSGERSGDMERVLDNLSELLEHDTVDRMNRMVNLSDACLSGFLMLTIGISLLSVMLPLIGVMNSIG